MTAVLCIAFLFQIYCDLAFTGIRAVSNTNLIIGITVGVPIAVVCFIIIIILGCIKLTKRIMQENQK